MKNNSFLLLILAIIGTIGLQSCGNNEPIEDNVIDKEIFDPNSSLNTIFDGKIFSIPSPVQTAFLIKNLDMSFDASLGNNIDNVDEYVSEYQQSLNLGVYGADLGYSALYDQKDNTVKCLNSVQNLTTQLGLDAAFDEKFLASFEASTDDEKEMIQLMSTAFKKADNFLKHANRKSTSALILTGGWIESVYIACNLNSKNPSEKVKKRIGEQKQSIGSIIDILTEYNKDEQSKELISDLKDLKLTFDKVSISYEYNAPETDKELKTTTLRHDSEVIISPKALHEIESKIYNIRSKITKV